MILEVLVFKFMFADIVKGKVSFILKHCYKDYSRLSKEHLKDIVMQFVDLQDYGTSKGKVQK